MRKVILLFVGLVALVACDSRPKDVLSKSAMEQVLYDYHLAQGMITNLPSDKRREMADSYIKAVYEKHGITEAQFDSSMVWYSRHTKDMKDIYDNLYQRYKSVDEEMKLKSGSSEMGYFFAENGDTTNIWNGEKLLVLRNGELFNRECFTIKADTSFRKKDRFVLLSNACFIKENKDDRDCSLVVSLSMQYKDGKTVGSTRNVSYPGSQQLTIEAIEDKDIESVSIFFYYNGKSDMRNMSVIDNIALYRIHTQKKEAVVDSLQTDTLAADSVAKADSLAKVRPVVVADTTVHERLNPEELREQTKGDRRINIKSRPDVIRPNSVGPTRRKKINK
ncbi:MAG: DUF4296 domain-containing protein [Bacteroides sp.]|nr:DUF4296 domain-containing protein [Roseburia sp.]MCM1346580.1 DUF4296 domain-containing protein [Bacteroides sp.]MCM1421406.1 DUF4296 domain-containing protein [Bacteroides sp.]